MGYVGEEREKERYRGRRRKKQRVGRDRHGYYYPVSYPNCGRIYHRNAYTLLYFNTYSSGILQIQMVLCLCRASIRQRDVAILPLLFGPGSSASFQHNVQALLVPGGKVLLLYKVRCVAACLAVNRLSAWPSY